jgi:hypothetical protein
MKLSNKIKFTISDGNEKIFNEYVYVKKMTRKQERKLQKLILSAQDMIEDDQLDALDEIEKAARLRFDYQISGDDDIVKTLAEIGDEYGYSTLMGEVDAILGNA